MCFSPGRVGDLAQPLAGNNIIPWNPWMNSYIFTLNFSEMFLSSFLLCLFQFIDLSFTTGIPKCLKLLPPFLHDRKYPAQVPMFHIIRSMIDFANSIFSSFVALAVQSVTQQE